MAHLVWQGFITNVELVSEVRPEDVMKGFTAIGKVDLPSISINELLERLHVALDVIEEGDDECRTV